MLHTSHPKWISCPPDVKRKSKKRLQNYLFHTIYLLFLVLLFNRPVTAVEPLSNNQIREIMILQTIKTHTQCPCPYSPDAMGGQCGNLSLYYQPGALKIYCYLKDIPSEDVYFFRLKNYQNAELLELREALAQQASVKTGDEKGTQTRIENYFKNNASTFSAPEKQSPAQDALPRKTPLVSDVSASVNFMKENAENYSHAP